MQRARVWQSSSTRRRPRLRARSSKWIRTSNDARSTANGRGASAKSREGSDRTWNVVVSFATLFIVLAAYALLETARDTLFLSHLHAHKLPWAYLSTAVAVSLARAMTLRDMLVDVLRTAGPAFGIMAHALAFRLLELRCTCVSILPENTASRRVAEKLGMRLADDEAASPGYGARFHGRRGHLLQGRLWRHPWL